MGWIHVVTGHVAARRRVSLRQPTRSRASDAKPVDSEVTSHHCICYTSHPFVTHNCPVSWNRILLATYITYTDIMPPKSRSLRSGTKSHQSTLAFHGSSNKVTKSGVKAQAAKKSNLEKKLKDATPEILELTAAEPTTTEAAIIEQTKQEIQAQQVERSVEEEQARRISDAAIKKYWAAKEKQRKAPRVHQEGLSLEEKILREFDMSAHFGVSFSQAVSCDLKLPVVQNNADILRTTAMYRNCSTEAVEACAAARPGAAGRSTGGAAKGSRCEPTR